MLQEILCQLDALGISRDVVVTISIFFLGFVLNRIYDRHIERRHLKKVRAFVIVYLQSLEKPIEQQVAAYQEFADQLSSLKHQDMIFQEDAIRSDYLKSVSQLDVFRALVFGLGKMRDRRIENLNSVLEALDYIERLRRLANLQFNYLFETYKSYSLIWNDSTNAIQRHFDSYRSAAKRNNIPSSEDPFLRDLDKLIYTWQQSPDGEEMQVMLDKYVHPVKDLCLKYFEDPRAMTLLPLTLNASNAFTNRKNLLTTMAKFFQGEVVKLTKKGEVIKQVVSTYKSASRATA